MGQCGSTAQPYKPEMRNINAIRTKNLIGNMLQDECELKLETNKEDQIDHSEYDSSSTTAGDMYSNVTKSSNRKQRDSNSTLTLFAGSTFKDDKHDTSNEDNVHSIENKNQSINHLLMHPEFAVNMSGVAETCNNRKVKSFVTRDQDEEIDTVHNLETIQSHLRHGAPHPQHKKLNSSMSTKLKTYTSKRSSKLMSNMSSQHSPTLSNNSSIHLTNTQASNMEQIGNEANTSTFGSEFEGLNDGPSNTSGIAQTDVNQVNIDIRGNMIENDSFNSPRSVQQNSMIFRPQCTNGHLQGNSNDLKQSTEDTLHSTSSSRVEALQSFPSIQKISNIQQTNSSKDKSQLLRKSKNPMPEFRLFSKPLFAQTKWLANKPKTDLSTDTEDQDDSSWRQQQLYVL